MLFTEIERGKQHQRKDRGSDGGNTGPRDTEGWKAELPEYHCVAKWHVDAKAENVADHDHVGPADPGEVR